MKCLDIGEVITQSGLTAATLRYYESLGLIRPIGRKGLRRQYAESVLEKLALIALGQQGGLSLKEVTAMFGDQGKLNIDRPMLKSKAFEIDKEISRLQRVREGLWHVAHCPHTNHLQCQEFQKMLSAIKHQNS